MTSFNLTEGYVAGFIDNVGGFSIKNVKGRKKSHPSYKIVCKKENLPKLIILEKIIDWFFEEHDIGFSKFEHGKLITFQIERHYDLERFLFWHYKNCQLPKKNMDEVIKLVKEHNLKTSVPKSIDKP